MLNSHMDTVPVANMAIDPFDPVVRAGRVYGRGACDAKGPIAAMLAAVTAYAESGARPATVVFAAMADEEFAFSGAWKLVEREWPVSACVVGEPTRLSLIVAHKGVARWRLRVKGKSAHGATPHLGLPPVALYRQPRPPGAHLEFAPQAPRSLRRRGAVMHCHPFK